MSNRRKEIRNGFVQHLLGKTMAEERVFPNRIRHISEDELPLISVQTGEENVDIFDQAPRRYRRTLEVSVECYVKNVEHVDQMLDNLLFEIETAFDTEDRFNLIDVVDEVIYNGSNIAKHGGEAVQESGYGVVRYTVIYFTWAGARTEFLDELRTVHGNFDDRVSTDLDFNED